jgi:hypothetical protein
MKSYRVKAEEIHGYFENGARPRNIAIDVSTTGNDIYFLITDENGHTVSHLEIDRDSWQSALTAMHLAEIPF